MSSVVETRGLLVGPAAARCVEHRRRFLVDHLKGVDNSLERCEGSLAKFCVVVLLFMQEGEKMMKSHLLSEKMVEQNVMKVEDDTMHNEG